MTYSKVERADDVRFSDLQYSEHSMPDPFDRVEIVLLSQPDLNPLHLGPDGDDRSANVVPVVELFSNHRADEVLPDSIE